MDRLRYPPVVVLTAAIFLAYSFFSCSTGSESTKDLEKYDSYDFADEATFNRPYDETYRAAVASLEDMGFVIATSDERAGEIQGEHEADELRPEERRDAETTDDSGGPIVGILAAIAFAIVMLFVTPGCESEREDASTSPMDENEPERTYIYVVTLSLRSSDPETTTVSLGTARFDYDDGELVRRVDLENKYLNHGLLDRVEAHLNLGPAPSSLPPN